MSLQRQAKRDLSARRNLFARLFDDPLVPLTWPELEPFGTIPLDIVEEEGGLRVTASLPGVQPDDLHVEVDDDTLRIWGESRADKERKEDTYYLRERRYGRAERAVRLPYAVEAERAQAEFDNGVLTLTLPRAETEGRKEIKVEAKR